MRADTGSRRDFFRTAAPAVALPMLAAIPVDAKDLRLVTRDEIMDAFRFFDRMELRAEDLNLRYQLLIDMLFETNPANLRDKLQALKDLRKDRPVLVDPYTAQTVPFDPAMYDDMGRLKVEVRQEPVETFSTEGWGTAEPDYRQWLPKPKLRTRIARFVRRQVIGI